MGGGQASMGGDNGPMGGTPPHLVTLYIFMLQSKYNTNNDAIFMGFYI